MMDISTLYILVMLSDVKELIGNHYGLTVLAALCNTSWVFSLLSSNIDKTKDVFKPYRKYLVGLVFVVWVFQAASNAVCAFIPNTAQLALILGGSKVMQSETIKELQELDPALAEWLKTKRVEILEEVKE